MLFQKKNIAQTDEFTKALRDWLSGEVTGHLGTYMYTDDTDDHRWKDGHSAKTYYLGRDDKASFNLALNELAIEVQNFLDLGPGGEASVRAKTIPIAKTIKAKRYFPVDLSATLAQAAVDLVSRELGITGSSVITDFFSNIPESRPNSLLAIMGGTIGNFETYTDPEELQNRLSQIFAIYKKAVGVGSYFLVSFDANTNGQEILACYKNDEFGSLVRSCVDRALDTSGFDYDVVWTPENYQLATGLRSKYDQMVSLDGDQFAIEKGEFLPVLNSYRFPVPFVIKAAEKAGWAFQKSWTATGRVHYVLFK